MAKKTTTKRAAKSAPKRPTKKKAAPKKSTPKKASAQKPVTDKPLSCIDAAAQVLAKAKTSMTTADLIAAMGAQKLWTSPGGKTPQRTLYSAILREIKVKGKDARFKKTERGKFAAA